MINTKWFLLPKKNQILNLVMGFCYLSLPLFGATDSIVAKAPTLPKGNTGTVTLPKVNDANVLLYGSDNQQIVKLDGRFYRPLVDMDVNVLYKVEQRGVWSYSAKDLKFKVPGKYKGKGVNHAPDVLPALREWYGRTGNFVLTGNMSLGASTPEARAAAEKTKEFFKDMLGIDVGINNKGEIEFLLDSNFKEELGEEGYYLTIASNKITIKAATKKALMYGGATVTQIFYASKDKKTAPQGEARDYPKYPIRAGMIDVGRTYIPLDYLEGIGRYMAYFKLNELHVHLNDSWTLDSQTLIYKGFRLQSDRYPEINYNVDMANKISDGFYTKNDYRNFQKKLLEYGIEVVNEIDTPAHSAIFRDIPNGPPMLDADNIPYMDITTDENRAKVVKFVLDLFDEFTSGNAPVFVGKKVHFGGDEYVSGHQPAQAAYNNEMTSALLARGLQVRMWSEQSSFHSNFLDTNARNENVTINMWAPYFADTRSVYDKGYNVINTVGGWLYLVPGCLNGYPDRWGICYPFIRDPFNGDYTYPYLYDSFDVNNFSPKRRAGVGTTVMPIAHPQTKGAQFCVWHDFTGFGGGFSEFDIFDRMKEVIAFVAEKTWYGEKTQGQTYDSFAARRNKHYGRAPGANLGRYVESKTDLVVSYDFTSDKPTADKSGNGYDALAIDSVIVSDGLRLPAGKALGLPFKSIGYPYTVNLKAKLSDVPANTILFEGRDGVLYANFQPNGADSPTGNIGFTRGEKGMEYQFEFKSTDESVVLPNQVKGGQWVDITLACGQKDIALYVDGVEQVSRATTVWINNGKQFRTTKQGGRIDVTYDSNTFVLPVEKIFPGAEAIISSLKIYNRELSESEILEAYKSGLAMKFESKIGANAPVKIRNCDMTASKMASSVTNTDNAADFISLGGTFAAGDYLVYRNIDFGNGGYEKIMLVLSANAANAGKNIEIRLGDPKGQKIGAVTLTDTKSPKIFMEHFAEINKVTGVHDVCLYFPETASADLDFFIFTKYRFEVYKGDDPNDAEGYDYILNQTWETSADRDTRMKWFRDAGYGMFIHFGPYAVLGGMTMEPPYTAPYTPILKQSKEAEWIMKQPNMIPREIYREHASIVFNPASFNAKEIVQLAKDAGQKYIVVTARHHDGFSMYDTKIRNFKDYSITSVANGGLFKRDIVREIADACLDTNGEVRFCAYMTLPDWYDDTQYPKYGEGASGGGASFTGARNDVFAGDDSPARDLNREDYLSRLKGQLRELIVDYGAEAIWFDDGGMIKFTHAQSYSLYNYIRALNPNIIVNNRAFTYRVKTDASSRAVNIDYRTAEQHTLTAKPNYDFEACMTLNRSWGYRINDNNWKSPKQVVELLMQCVGLGGNLLLNIGPDAHGKVPEQSQEILQKVGQWLRPVSDSIYNTRTSFYDDGALPKGVYATVKEGKLFFHLMSSYTESSLTVPAPANKIKGAKILNTNQPIEIKNANGNLSFNLSKITRDPYDTVIQVDVDGYPAAVR